MLFRSVAGPRVWVSIAHVGASLQEGHRGSCTTEEDGLVWKVITVACEIGANKRGWKVDVVLLQCDIRGGTDIR